MKPILFFLFVFITLSGTAYDFGTITYKDAKYNERNNTIDIVYDLREAQHNYYNYAVELYYSLDDGQTFVGPLRLVRGDVGGNVAPGANKSIQWDFSIEAPDFTGSNIQFSVRAKARMRPEFYSKFGGPKNAAWSVLVPGLGDQKVRHKNKIFYFGFAVAAFGALGVGIIQHTKATDSYQQYQLAENAEDANYYYNQSQEQLKQSTMLFGAAAVIWVTDITLVTIKGFQNKKLIRDTFPKATTVKVGVAVNYTTPGLGLSFKF